MYIPISYKQFQCFHPTCKSMHKWKVNCNLKQKAKGSLAQCLASSGINNKEQTFPYTCHIRTFLTSQLWNLFGARLGWKNSQGNLSSELQKEWGISKCLACYSAYLIGLGAKCFAVITLQTHICISLHICHITMFQMGAVDHTYLHILCHISV